MGLSTGVMGLVSMGMQAASSAASAKGAYDQAKAEKLAADWNAGIMEENAKMQELLAEQELEKGKHNVALAKMEGDLLIESQRGGFAAGGIKVDTGSALDVVVEQAGRNKYDQDMLKYNAEMSAWGRKMEAANLRQNAAMTRNTGRSPGAAAFTSALSGGTNLMNQYNQYQMYAKKKEGLV